MDIELKEHNDIKQQTTDCNDLLLTSQGKCVRERDKNCINTSIERLQRIWELQRKCCNSVRCVGYMDIDKEIAAESRKQKAESRKQKAESRKQKIVTTIDLSVKHPSVRLIANCITARENRGISKIQSMGNSVVMLIIEKYLG